jgi:hypothetical protein
MMDMVPHNHSMQDPKANDVSNAEPPRDQLGINVGMLSDEEFDDRTTALLEEGFRAEIEAFNKVTPIISEESHPWLSSEENSDAP